MTPPLSALAYPLPDDLSRMKEAGFYEDCRAAIARQLSGDLSAPLRARLELELLRLDFLPDSEYPYSDREALRLLDDTFLDFRPEELDRLVRDRAMDWLYREGRRRFHRRFLSNILTTRPDYAARLKDPALAPDSPRKRRVGENLSIMRERGGRTAKLTLRQTFRLKPHALRPGVPLTVHLPLPRLCAHQTDVQVLALSHPEGAILAPETAPQRTVCFPNAPAGDTFSATYSYVNHLNYVNPSPDQARPGHPPELDRYLAPEAPHVLFTPLMEAISREIQGGEENPLKKARNAYDFVTTQVLYSYMREYAALDTLCDYAVKNRKGDCGVQAILFITLCRLAGVPARWQSGFAADPDFVGCHDWAEFYVNPYGWLHADCSYGGSAYRSGALERWNYYFGNLDIFRMTANSALQSEFTPPKAFFRADPVDNQRGEAEYPDRGLLPFDFDHTEELLDFHEL